MSQNSTRTKETISDAFTSRSELAAKLAADIAAALRAKLENSNIAWLAVSGGSTPALLFEELSKQALDWEKVKITLVDERWVNEENPRSNGAMLRAALLRNKAASAQFVPLFDGAIPADAIDENASILEARLPDLTERFAMLVLGMGNDGHTASLFPGSDQLEQATDLTSAKVLISINAPGAPEPRITMTLARILCSEKIVLHIQGEEKLEVLEKAMEDGDPDLLPIRHVLQNAPDMKIYYAP